MRTRREIKRDIRRARRDVKTASVEDDGPRFVALRKIYDALRDELAALDAPPPPAELPPGTGTFTMRKTPRTETEADRWDKVLAMRGGGGPARVIHTPEADVARAVKIRDCREHVTGLVPKSAMRQAR